MDQYTKRSSSSKCFPLNRDTNHLIYDLRILVRFWKDNVFENEYLAQNKLIK